MTIELKSPAAIEALGKALTDMANAAKADASAIGDAFSALGKSLTADPNADPGEARHNALCAVAAEFAVWMESMEAMIAEYHVNTAHARREFLENLGLQVTN